MSLEGVKLFSPVGDIITKSSGQLADCAEAYPGLRLTVENGGIRDGVAIGDLQTQELALQGTKQGQRERGRDIGSKCPP